MPDLAPSKIVCVGRNYAAHARELGNEVPKQPLLFLKPPSSLVRSGASIRLPTVSNRVEYEGEIGVVVGERLRKVSPQQARAASSRFFCGIVASGYSGSVKNRAARVGTRARW